MKKRTLLIAVPVLAAVLALSAVAFVPGVLKSLNPGSGAAQAASIPVPTWHTGDTWTYNVSFAETENGTTAASANVTGHVTRTVVGTVSTPQGEAYNVSVKDGFAFGAPVSLNSYDLLSVAGANVTAYEWYLTSDLAKVSEVRIVSMSSSYTFDNSTWTVSYRAAVAVSYQPALAIWQFPLTENATYNVSSNATVHYAATYSFSGPNATFSSSHEANFTFPVRFSVHTGTAGSVTTPAGTFTAIPASLYRAPEPTNVPDADASLALNLTDESFEEPSGAPVTVWFSGQPANVVQAVVGNPGEFLVVALASYKVA